uniref:Uncharacterized protein n=1 Tax=Arundo donax TaxID=35708 RepID=A0A0A9BH42_ARUDO
MKVWLCQRKCLLWRRLVQWMLSW